MSLLSLCATVRPPVNPRGRSTTLGRVVLPGPLTRTREVSLSPECYSCSSTVAVAVHQSVRGVQVTVVHPGYSRRDTWARCTCLPTPAWVHTTPAPPCPIRHHVQQYSRVHWAELPQFSPREGRSTQGRVIPLPRERRSPQGRVIPLPRGVPEVSQRWSRSDKSGHSWVIPDLLLVQSQVALCHIPLKSGYRRCQKVAILLDSWNKGDRR